MQSSLRPESLRMHGVQCGKMEHCRVVYTLRVQNPAEGLQVHAM